MITLGNSDVFMVVFSDEHGQLPPHHDRCGWEPLLHGPASPGFSASDVRRTPPARLRRDAPVYRGRMSMAHGQDKCEVNVVIPLNPMEPWMAIVIGVELDETVEQTTQVALTSM
jgi:hypothetical protein